MKPGTIDTECSIYAGRKYVPPKLAVDATAIVMKRVKLYPVLIDS